MVRSAVPATVEDCADNAPEDVTVRSAVPDTVADWAVGEPEPVTTFPTCPVPDAVED